MTLSIKISIATVLAVAVLPSFAWETVTTSPDIDGKTSSYQAVRSDRPVELERPYSGSQLMTLVLRKNGDVALLIDRGQIHCGEYRQRLKVKFDEAQSFSVSCTGAANGKSNVVFPDLSKAQVAQMKKAKKIVMEVPFYSQQSQLVTFSSPTPAK